MKTVGLLTLMVGVMLSGFGCKKETPKTEAEKTINTAADTADKDAEALQKKLDEAFKK